MPPRQPPTPTATTPTEPTKRSVGGEKVKGFRSFILRGNVVDLAVGIVIGAASTAVVNGFVSAFLTPLVGLATGATGDMSHKTFAVAPPSSPTAPSSTRRSASSPSPCTSWSCSRSTTPRTPRPAPRRPSPPTGLPRMPQPPHPPRPDAAPPAPSPCPPSRSGCGDNPARPVTRLHGPAWVAGPVAGMSVVTAVTDGARCRTRCVAGQRRVQFPVKDIGQRAQALSGEPCRHLRGAPHALPSLPVTPAKASTHTCLRTRSTARYLTRDAHTRGGLRPTTASGPPERCWFNRHSRDPRSPSAIRNRR
ncbi:MscL family protein [Streptomyces sp. NPDC057438]|uniref:MscL family protein n=1 Tax=Streptomyces sp. NPDC057438 TaxID=3346133 RepID=UPI0036AD2A33